MEKKLPELTDIYAFGDWLKKHYSGSGRDWLVIQPIQGGLIKVHSVKHGEVDAAFSLADATWEK